MMLASSSNQGTLGAAPVARGDVPAEPTSKKQLKIDVTEAAIRQIAKLWGKRTAEGKTPSGLRVGLRGGGCDGFSYLFEWADGEAQARDTVFAFAVPADLKSTLPSFDEVRVFVDKKSLIYLQGTTLNFVTGLMGHGFKFENPNVKGSCGCGESVQF